MAIKKKFISGTPAEAIDGSKVLFANNEAFRVKNASGVAEELFKYDSSNVLKLLKLPQVAADPSAADDLVRKSFLDGQVSTLQGLISAEESARIAAVSAEEAARIAGDEALDGRLDILEPKVSTLEGEMNAVEGRLDVVEPKVTTLEGEMDAVEGRATALEGRATSLETSVGVLNGNSSVEGSVDYKVGQAVNQILGGVDGAYDTLAEIAAYIASDTSGGAAMLAQLNDHEQRLDTLEGGIEVVGSVDYKIGEEAALREAAIQTVQGFIDGEISRATTAEAGLQSAIEGEAAARAADVQSLMDADLQIGQTISALELSLGDSIAAETLARETAVDQVTSDLQLEAQSREAGDLQLSGEISALETNLTASIQNVSDTLSSQISSEATTRASEDALTLQSAQTYADTAVETAVLALKDGVSSSYDSLKKIEDKIGFIMANTDGAALDSLSEIVAAFQGADSNINQAISDLAATASTNLSAEQTRAQNAEAALGVRIDGVEADLGTEEAARIAGDASTLVDAKAYTDAQLDTLVIQQQQYVAKTLASGDVSAQYVDVSGPIVGTPWVMIDGVMGRPGVDFTHSGSRITFAGEWATGGESALVSGDVLHVFFMKEYSPFV